MLFECSISIYTPKAIIKGRNTSETIDINFIRIFKEGPEVSLHGSPTVSPIIVAL
jgi:hypothetical protein